MVVASPEKERPRELGCGIRLRRGGCGNGRPRAGRSPVRGRRLPRPPCEGRRARGTGGDAACSPMAAVAPGGPRTRGAARRRSLDEVGPPGRQPSDAPRHRRAGRRFRLAEGSVVTVPDQENRRQGRGAPVARRTMLGMLGARRRRRGRRALCSSAAGRASSARPPQGPHRPDRAAAQRRRLPLLLASPRSVPRKDERDYRLTVDGLVDRPRTYTLADLRALPQTRLVRDVQCVDRLAGAGHPLRGRAAVATCSTPPGCAPRAKAVRFTCFDGAYTESLTLEQARRADVLVALRMQDKPRQPRARRPGPALRGADVLLQVGQVALRHHRHRRGRARLLGGARLRRRRLGRPVERTRRCTRPA